MREVGIQDFEMIHVLGKGGVGVVWLAKKIDTEEVHNSLLL